MAKPREIELSPETVIPILYEDRAILAIDKPSGWILAPDSWDQTARNLQLALVSSLNSGAFWSRSRNLKYIRFIHRLDSETSGVLLLAKNAGVLPVYSRLFESRQVEKTYLAVVKGIPSQTQWTCTATLAPDPHQAGRMLANIPDGKPCETRFEVIKTGPGCALVRARPLTGRTHQLRVHLACSGHPIINDSLYGSLSPMFAQAPAALRAISLAYQDPFQKHPVRISAPNEEFLARYGFGGAPKANNNATDSGG
jgi:RluA family pseudouridine synthase